MKIAILLATSACLVAPWSAFAGGDAAPSSHFVFDDNFEGDIIINEVRVPEDGEALYTYYETLGWQGEAGGYAGIQAHPKAHNFIFSIWDHKSHQAPIRAVHQGPGTEVQKFGGEGTGLKSWNFELGWKTDVWYTLVSRCWEVDDHTWFGFWARAGDTGEWAHLVTMDVAADKAYFRGGTDAFIEDWLETGKNARTTHLRGGWKRKLDGDWHAFGQGRYSVNAWDLVEGKRSYNFRTNWNGGIAEDDDGLFYFMTAGGASTEPTTENPSVHAIERRESEPAYPPIEIEEAGGRLGDAGQAVVTWTTTAGTLPQFGYSVLAHDNPDGAGEPVAAVHEIDPSARQAEIPLSDARRIRRLYFRLVCRDILDHEAVVLVNP